MQARALRYRRGGADRRLHDVRGPRLVLKIEAAIGKHRRSREITGESLGPVHLARLCVEARRHAIVRHRVQFILHDKHRWRERRAFRSRPRHMLLGDIAGRSFGIDRH